MNVITVPLKKWRFWSRKHSRHLESNMVRLSFTKVYGHDLSKPQRISWYPTSVALFFPVQSDEV